MRKTTKTILFLGTDGAGKTSITTELKKKLPESKWHYFGLKQHAYSFIENYYQKTGISNRLYKYVLCPLDLHKRKKQLTKGTINIIDRFPGWAFYNASWVTSLLYRLALPKIDAVVYLNVSAEKIAERKGITDTAHISKELTKWTAVFNTIKANHKFELDTSHTTLEKSTETIEKWLKENVLND
jgi:thymidylate kinase